MNLRKLCKRYDFSMAQVGRRIGKCDETMTRYNKKRYCPMTVRLAIGCTIGAPMDEVNACFDTESLNDDKEVEE